jgi:butyryl-CoA dehydrogenase
MELTASSARSSSVEERFTGAVMQALSSVEALTGQLSSKGSSGDLDGMLLHSSDYLEAFGILAVAWQHLAMMAAAKRGLALGGDDAAFFRGKLLAGEYWITTELRRLDSLVALCLSGEDSYARARPEDF